MNENARTIQRWLIIGLVGLVCVFFFAIILYVLREKKVSEKTYVSSVDLPLDRVDPKEIWMDQVRTQNEIVHEKVDFIQGMMLGKIKEEEVKENVMQNEITSLRNEVQMLKSEMRKSHDTTIENLRSELKNVSETHRQRSEDPFEFAPPAPPENFELLTRVECPEPTTLRHIDRAIPCGTTVKAILLSSVDMPCGIRGSTDPLPVKLRIIANGRLPHQVRAKLKSGIVTASVYGDLSSERVYFRLEKLTHVRPDGNFIETQIAGYVSGEDGKYGMRGTVVDKSCQMIENALISGFLSGASDFFETATMARLAPCATLDGCLPNLNFKQSAGQLGLAGGCQGVSNAMDALTDYFISRAEQLRPVIQITPGRIVDITFSDSADLGDLHTHERVRTSGEAICGR